MVQSLVCHQMATGETGTKKWICIKREVHSHKKVNIWRAKLSQLTGIEW